jgi:hypothetical protein
VVGKLGQWVDDPDDHTTAFIAGNVRTNHWTKIRPDAPPGAVAAHLRALLAENDGAQVAAPSADVAAPTAAR